MHPLTFKEFECDCNFAISVMNFSHSVSPISFLVHVVPEELLTAFLASNTVPTNEARIDRAILVRQESGQVLNELAPFEEIQLLAESAGC